MDPRSLYKDEANHTNNYVAFNSVRTKLKDVVTHVTTSYEDNSDIDNELYSTYQLTCDELIGLQTKNHPLKEEVKSLTELNACLNDECSKLRFKCKKLNEQCREVDSTLNKKNLMNNVVKLIQL